jgi:hypothetical protein
MASITHSCKWAVGIAVSIWLAVAGTAQARVVLLEHLVLLDDPYNSSEQVVVAFKGCRTSETGSEKLLLLLRQRQTAELAPTTRIAMASPARAAHVSLPLMVGVGF